MARGKGEGALFQRKNGVWVGRIELPPDLNNDRPRKEFSSKSKQVVLDKMRETQRQLEEYGDLPRQQVQLSRWMRVYLDEIAAKKDRPGTLTDKRSINKLFIEPLLGKKRLDKLTAADVRRLHKVILNTPKKQKDRDKDPADLPADTQMLSTSYAANAHNLLSAALKAAVREGYIRTNVCTRVDKPTVITRQDNSLLPQQVRAVLKHAMESEHGAMWATFLLSGARRGEVLGMEIDRYNGHIMDISWQLQGMKQDTKFRDDFEYRHVTGSRYLTRPKTQDSTRVTPIIEPLRLILDRHIGDRTSGLIFINDNGDPFYPTTVTKMWARMMKDLKMPPVTLHGARHALIDLLNDNGVSEGVIMDIFGHTSRAVSQGYRTRGNLDGATKAIETAWESLNI